MKKLTKFSLLGLALSLCVGAAAISGSKSPSKVVADDGGLELVMTNDTDTCSDTIFYSREGSDFQYLDWTTLNKNNTSHFSIPGATTNNYTVSEDSSNKLYNYCYRPFFVYPRFKGTGYMEAKKRYVMDVTFSLSLTKTASAGSAYAHAELFFFGNGNGKPTPVLTNNRFETPTEHNQDYSNSYGSASNTNKSIGCYTKKVNSAVVATKQLSITFDNETTSPQVVRYQLGLFVGNNYASSEPHRASAVVSYTINSVTKYDVVAENAGNAYLTLDEAVNAAASGSTINIRNNCNCGIDSTANSYLDKNLTINLNGYTVSMIDYTDGIGVKSGRTLTINGGGGSIVNNNLENQNARPVLVVSAGGTLTVSNVTISKPNGGNAAVEVYGTFNASTDVTISTNSPYINGYAVRVWDTGATANLNGVTISSSQTAVSVEEGAVLICHNCTISSSNSYAIATNSCLDANEIYLSGATTLSHGGSATANISMYSTGGNDKIYGYHTSYLSVAVSVTIVGTSYSDGTTVVSSDKNKKVSIVSSPATGYEYARSMNNIIYQRIKYTVSFNSNGGSGSIASRSIAYGETTSLPACSFTAPAGKKFLEWNTKANGTGVSKNPGDTYQPTAKTTFYAIWVDTVKSIIESTVITRSSLAYHYSTTNEGFEFSNVVVRFGGIITKDLWDQLDAESTILGYGTMSSTDTYLGANELKSYYASPDGTNVRKYYHALTNDPTSYPALYDDSNYQGVVNDYYVWNLTKTVSEVNFKKVYASLAFIVTEDDGVVFLDEVRASVKSLAQDLIDGPDYDALSLEGSLNYLANL